MMLMLIMMMLMAVSMPLMTMIMPMKVMMTLMKIMVKISMMIRSRPGQGLSRLFVRNLMENGR